MRVNNTIINIAHVQMRAAAVCHSPKAAGSVAAPGPGHRQAVVLLQTLAPGESFLSRGRGKNKALLWT